MRIRPVVLVVATTAAVVCAGTTTLAHAGGAPPGYLYKSCVGTEAVCPFTGQTDARSKSVAVNGSAFCRTGSAALHKLGFVKLASGKRSVRRTIRVRRSKSTRIVVVSLTVRLRVGKTLTGAVRLTTRASDCSAQSGRLMHFSMTYAGPL